MELLVQDPTSTVKWLAIAMALVGIYLQIRGWEHKLTGKIEQIDIKQPVSVLETLPPVTRADLLPVLSRVDRLEIEVRDIRTAMAEDKQEIITKIDDLSQRTHEGFRSIERAIGRLEGPHLHKP